MRRLVIYSGDSLHFTAIVRSSIDAEALRQLDVLFDARSRRQRVDHSREFDAGKWRAEVTGTRLCRFGIARTQSESESQ